MLPCCAWLAACAAGDCLTDGALVVSEGGTGKVSLVFLDAGDGWSTGAAPLAGASSTSSEMNDCLPSKEWSGVSTCALAATAAEASTGRGSACAAAALGSGVGALCAGGDAGEGSEGRFPAAAERFAPASCCFATEVPGALAGGAAAIWFAEAGAA